MRQPGRHRAVLTIATLTFAIGAVAVRHPTVDLRFVTHDLRDPAPARLQAAIDLGLLGISVLYTWTRRLG